MPALRITNVQDAQLDRKAFPVLTPANNDRVTAVPAGINTSRAVEIWLWAIIALVFAMVVVGGATRLTDSGLSITEWQPLLGAIPPMSDGDWLVAFEKYKQIPQYALVNKGMALTEFKFIYWWEWSHRLLGRLIGVAFAIPFLFFWATGRLRAGVALKLLGVLAIGALQGAIGWYMVKSGLADRVSVSQYRLALHLGTASRSSDCWCGWRAMKVPRVAPGRGASHRSQSDCGLWLSQRLFPCRSCLEPLLRA